MRRRGRVALLCTVPGAAMFAGPELLGYGWGRLAAAGASLLAIAGLWHELVVR